MNNSANPRLQRKHVYSAILVVAGFCWWLGCGMTRVLERQHGFQRIGLQAVEGQVNLQFPSSSILKTAVREDEWSGSVLFAHLIVPASEGRMLIEELRGDSVDPANSSLYHPPPGAGIPWPVKGRRPVFGARRGKLMREEGMLDIVFMTPVGPSQSVFLEWRRN